MNDQFYVIFHNVLCFTKGSDINSLCLIHAAKYDNYSNLEGLARNRNDALNPKNKKNTIAVLRHSFLTVKQELKLNIDTLIL